MKKNTVTHSMALAPILAAALAGAAPAQAQELAVIAPNRLVHGATYGEWSAQWWNWAFSVLAPLSPFNDDGGSCHHGAIAQSGPVWFLVGGAATGSIYRHCTVPAGRTLFVPILTVECSTLEGNGATEHELRACATGYATDGVWAKVNGVPVTNVARYQVTSPLFTMTVEPNNVFGLGAGVTPSVASGYYLMLSPLQARADGKPHRIQFGGSYTGFLTLDVTYDITVAYERP